MKFVEKRKASKHDCLHVILGSTKNLNSVKKQIPVLLCSFAILKSYGKTYLKSKLFWAWSRIKTLTGSFLRQTRPEQTFPRSQLAPLLHAPQHDPPLFGGLNVLERDIKWSLWLANNHFWPHSVDQYVQNVCIVVYILILNRINII